MRYFEQVVWMFALVALFFMDLSNPASEAASFCIFNWAGFTSCPGCGLGHAIHHALHFNFKLSLTHHILGIPATIGILYIIFKPFIPPKKTKYGLRGNAFDAARDST